MKVQQTIDKLKKQFPDMWFKHGSEFYDDDSKKFIWTGEGSHIDGDYAFAHWGYSDTIGVHPKLAKALDKLGLYAEFYDAGTVFIYQD
jgi:hypothetical protein